MTILLSLRLIASPINSASSQFTLEYAFKPLEMLLRFCSCWLKTMCKSNYSFTVARSLFSLEIRLEVSWKCCSLVLWLAPLNSVIALCIYLLICLYFQAIIQLFNPLPLARALPLLVDLIITCSVIRSAQRPVQYPSLRLAMWRPPSLNHL